MKAGDYILNIEATTEDPKWPSQNWSWSQTFRITKEKAQQINQEALNDNVSAKQNKDVLIVGILFLSLSVVVILFLIIKRNIRKKESQKNH